MTFRAVGVTFDWHATAVECYCTRDHCYFCHQILSQVTVCLRGQHHLV